MRIFTVFCLARVSCTDPFKESARFLTAEISFGLFARSRSTLLPRDFPKTAYLPLTLRRIRLSIRNWPGTSHFTTPTFLATSKSPEVTNLYVIQRCCIKPEWCIKRIIGDSLVRLSRTSLEPGRRVVDRCCGHWWWIPIARGSPSDEQRVAEARREVVVTPPPIAAFFFLVRSKSRTPVCVLVVSYTPTIAYARSVLVARRTMMSPMKGREVVHQIETRVRAYSVDVRALMGPTVDVVGIVSGTVSPRFKYWLTQVGFKRVWERKEGLHRSGPYQVIVCKPRAALSQGRFSQAEISRGEERCFFSMMSSLRDTLRPRSHTDSKYVSPLRTNDEADSRNELIFLKICRHIFIIIRVNFFRIDLSYFFFS